MFFPFINRSKPRCESIEGLITIQRLAGRDRCVLPQTCGFDGQRQLVNDEFALGNNEFVA